MSFVFASASTSMLSMRRVRARGLRTSRYGVRTRSQNPSRRQRSGFVLVMCLVLVVVSAISLAGFARRSLESSSRAAEAQLDLQRRWGILSCLRLYLPAADAILESEAMKQP